MNPCFTEDIRWRSIVNSLVDQSNTWENVHIFLTSNEFWLARKKIIHAVNVIPNWPHACVAFVKETDFEGIDVACKKLRFALNNVSRQVLHEDSGHERHLAVDNVSHVPRLRYVTVRTHEWINGQRLRFFRSSPSCSPLGVSLGVCASE